MVKLLPRELREMDFPEARFLTEEEQARYEEACKSYTGKAKASLNVPKNGSNLFKVIKLNEMGIRTASLDDLELALENGMDLSGTFEDIPSIVLRSAGDSYGKNDYIAKALAELIKKRSFPHAVVIEGLKPKEDSLSDYGLSFEAGERFRVVEAPALDHANNQRRFNRINPDYSIDFYDNGKRVNYTREDGVGGLCLLGGSFLYSSDRGLGGSDGTGRVVVVSGEATAQKILGPYIDKIKLDSERQIKEIAERARKAENYVKTGKLE
mgnify:CR=1 FL=1